MPVKGSLETLIVITIAMQSSRKRTRIDGRTAESKEARKRYVLPKSEISRISRARSAITFRRLMLEFF